MSRRAEVARRPAAVRPPVRPVERAGGAGRGLRRRALRRRSSTTTRSTTSSRSSRASPASRAPRSTAAGSGRSTSSSIPSKAQARGVTSSRHRRGRRRSRTRSCPSGELHLAEVRRERLHERRPRGASQTIGDAIIKLQRRQAGPHPRRRAGRGRRRAGRRRPSRSTARTRVYLNVLRVPGGNTIEIVDAGEADRREPEGPAARREGRSRSSTSRPSCARPTTGSQKEIVQALVLIALVILLFLQSRARHARSSRRRSRSRSRSSSSSSTRPGRRLNAFTLGGLTLAMGPLVDIAVVVLESIHRHQRMGMSAGAGRARGHERGRARRCSRRRSPRWPCSCRCCCSRASRRSSSRRSRSRSRSRMIAGVLREHAASRRSRAATSSATPSTGASASAIEARHRSASPSGYARALRAVLPLSRWRHRRRALVLVVGSGWAAARLPSTFFPEIDESMERVYVRLAPGTSLEEASAQDRRDGRRRSRRSSRRAASSSCSPTSARPATRAAR